MVYDNRDVNFIAIDITCNVLGDTRRNIEKAYAGEPVKNVIIARHNIEDIRYIFAPEDRVERIYINFCNPWTKRPKYAKRRLTHPRQLMQYRDFLVDGGEIWFKTDDMPLFTESFTGKAGFIGKKTESAGDADYGYAFRPAHGERNDPERSG